MNRFCEYVKMTKHILEFILIWNTLLMLILCFNWEFQLRISLILKSEADIFLRKHNIYKGTSHFLQFFQSSYLWVRQKMLELT